MPWPRRSSATAAAAAPYDSLERLAERGVSDRGTILHSKIVILVIGSPVAALNLLWATMSTE